MFHVSLLLESSCEPCKSRPTKISQKPELEREALVLNSHAVVWCNKSSALCNLERYEEALWCVEEALRCDPGLAMAFDRKGRILYECGQREEALFFYDQALRLYSNMPELIQPQKLLIGDGFAIVYCHKGEIFHDLGRYENALALYDQALKLNVRCALAYSNRGRTLYALGRYTEAATLCDFAYRLDARDRSVQRAYHEIVQQDLSERNE